MQRNLLPLRLFALLAGLLLGACGTTAPSRFYLVSSPPTAAEPAPSTGPLVAIEIVDVPAYLGRDPIATQLSSHELLFAEFDRWAEPLADALRRVIAETFEARGAQIALRGEERDAAFLVRVELVALDGVLGQQLELRARWNVRTTGQEGAASMHRSVRTEAASGESEYAAWATAASLALQALAREIADSAGARG
jgi:uncharacterized lipoprotein YmbA